MDMFDYLFFDRVGYTFTRDVKDMSPYKIVIKDDNKLSLLLNTLGVAKDDIGVEIANSYDNRHTLTIKGSTKNELIGREYSVNLSFIVRKNIKNIEWDCKDGLTYLDLEFVAPAKLDVSITRK